MKSSGYLKEQNMTKAMPPSGREKGQTKKKKKKKSRVFESTVLLSGPELHLGFSPFWTPIFASRLPLGRVMTRLLETKETGVHSSCFFQPARTANHTLLSISWREYHRTYTQTLSVFEHSILELEAIFGAVDDVHYSKVRVIHRKKPDNEVNGGGYHMHVMMMHF